MKATGEHEMAIPDPTMPLVTYKVPPPTLPRRVRKEETERHVRMDR
jgi:hypothetical protein